VRVPNNAPTRYAATAATPSSAVVAAAPSPGNGASMIDVNNWFPQHHTAQCTGPAPLNLGSAAFRHPLESTAAVQSDGHVSTFNPRGHAHVLRPAVTSFGSPRC